MRTIIYDGSKCQFDPINMEFHISEKDIAFATKYSLKNPESGDSKVFNFTHSTGPEFDASTSWIYKSECGLTLSVNNDVNLVKVARDNYIKAKLNK